MNMKKIVVKMAKTILKNWKEVNEMMVRSSAYNM